MVIGCGRLPAVVRSVAADGAVLRRLAGPLLVVLVLCGCGVGGDAVSSTSAAVHDEARSVRSEAVLGRILRTDQPGCSAAVGVQGTVVWAGARGVADLATGQKLTPDTIFDIGSVAKQFTAAAVLLLADEGTLSTGDTVAQHLPGLPAWATRVTVAQLIRHTSGIPDIYELAETRNYMPLQRVTQAQIMRELAAVPALRFTPGQRFEYSNSGYVLLAEILHRLSGTALPQLLHQRIFRPLGLNMLLDPDGPIPGKATSYRYDSGGLQITDHHWEALGDGGIHTTASELVRWADNYRTGKLGGQHLLQAQLANTVSTPYADWAHGLGRDFTYAAGIAVAADGTLVHTGGSEGFKTAFEVSPDRRTAIAVTCNSTDTGATVLAAELRKIWT